MNRQQLYRCYAERLNVFYDFIGEPLIGAAPFFRQCAVELGEAAEMELVNNRVLPRDAAARGLALPIEIRVDDYAFRHERRAVAFVEGRIVARFELISENRWVPFQIAEMSARIRVEHQLVGIEAVPRGGLVGSMDAVAVNRPGVHIRHIAVPDLVGEFGKLDGRPLALAGLVEE